MMCLPTLPPAQARVPAGAGTRTEQKVIGSVLICRYREFVVFHGEFVLPEFLIAYQRFNGDERLSTHTAASECAVS